MISYKCDIILPICDQIIYAKNCIESIIRNTDVSYRIIVINNGKSKDIIEYLNDVKSRIGESIHIVDAGDNIGWVRSINRGLEISRAPFVCFQNDDTIVTGGWLSTMIAVMEENINVGIVNPVWEKPADTDIDVFADGIKKHGTNYIEMDWARGFSMVVRREVIEKIGGLDNIYIPFYYDDWDYSLKAIDEGYLCVMAEGAFVLHYKNVTAENVLSREKMKKIMDKNGKIFYGRWGKVFKIVFILNTTTDLIGEGIKTLCRMQSKIRCYITGKGCYRNTTLIESVVPRYAAFLRGFLPALFTKEKKVRQNHAGIFTDSRAIFNIMKMLNFSGKINIFYDSDPVKLADKAVNHLKMLKEKSKNNV